MRIVYERPPSAFFYMARAIMRDGASSNISTHAPKPLSATWRGHRVQPRQLAQLLHMCELERASTLPVLYPHIVGFRLNMALLTHPRFPLPIWNALQIRNRIKQHAPMPIDAAYDFTTSVRAPRILDKGVEIDLLTTFSSEGDLVWEGANTFYYRGRFGLAEARPPEAASPAPPEALHSTWRGPIGSGWAMARLTGDYNGIHLADAYARLFGFPRAFPHPQILTGQCLARLGRDDANPRALDLWLKGQAPYGAQLRLHAAEDGDALAFALFAEGQPKSLIVGRMHAAPADAAAP